MPSSFKKTNLQVLTFAALVVLCAAGIVLVAAKPAAGTPNDFYGISDEEIIAKNEGNQVKELALMHKNGVGLIRQTFSWSTIEPQKAQFNFELTDQLVENAAENGIRILPILFNPPAWASSAPTKNAKKGVYPPANPKDMAEFAVALVGRYGSQGTFWKTANRSNKFAIKSWQIWNEPNLPAYWPSGPNPRQYVKLLKPTYQSIRQADGKAEVVAAGIPNSRIGMPFKQYLTGFYKAGGKNYFDTLALHAYARTDRGVVEAVKTTRKVMRHFHDSAPIWITEIGWATKSPGESPFETSAQGQAKKIKALFSTLCKKRTALSVRGIVYFAWSDVRSYDGKDWWGIHTGLNQRNGSPKPALRAYHKATHC